MLELFGVVQHSRLQLLGEYDNFFVNIKSDDSSKGSKVINLYNGKYDKLTHLMLVTLLHLSPGTWDACHLK